MSNTSSTRPVRRGVSWKHKERVSSISFTYTERKPRWKSSTEVGSHSHRCELTEGVGGGEFRQVRGRLGVRTWRSEPGSVPLHSRIVYRQGGETQAFPQQLRRILLRDDAPPADVFAALQDVDTIHAAVALGHGSSHTVPPNVYDILQDQVPVGQGIRIKLVGYGRCVCVWCGCEEGG